MADAKLTPELIVWLWDLSGRVRSMGAPHWTIREIGDVADSLPALLDAAEERDRLRAFIESQGTKCETGEWEGASMITAGRHVGPCGTCPACRRRAALEGKR